MTYCNITFTAGCRRDSPSAVSAAGWSYDFSFDRDRVRPHTNVGKDEAETMGTGSLKNELQRRVEIATAARGSRNRDHTVAQRLAQGLDTGIEHHTVITIRILDTSQNGIGAGGYRICDLNQSAS